MHYPRRNDLLTTPTISYHFDFFHLSRVVNMLHHGSVGPAQFKERYFMFSFTFAYVSHHKICLFIILFFFFFDQVLNFRNRILTNQKQEFVDTKLSVELYEQYKRTLSPVTISGSLKFCCGILLLHQKKR